MQVKRNFSKLMWALNEIELKKRYRRLFKVSTVSYVISMLSMSTIMAPIIVLVGLYIYGTHLQCREANRKPLKHK